MPRLLRDLSEVAAAIERGEHDAELDYISQACAQRKKRLWRVGTVVILTDEARELAGRRGRITKVNAKSIGVRLDLTDKQRAEMEEALKSWAKDYPDVEAMFSDEYRVSPGLLRIATPEEAA